MSSPRNLAAAAIAVVLAGSLLAACSGPAGDARRGIVQAVGAENQYADVISQIGGRYVSVQAILQNPATDPHTFESNPSVAATVSAAELVVQNGLGYDDFMTEIENATPSSSRRVIDVQKLLGLASSTPNPHLWYSPLTMPKVAAAVAADLSDLQPAHRAYFEANVRRFDHSLERWFAELARLRARFRGAEVATTEPVADYMLQAAGLDNVTPFVFQADVMNGIDPSPQGISAVRSLLAGGKVRAFVYNEQVTDSLTQSLIPIAEQHHVPLVGVYETMPVPGYHYQSWMLAEATALYRALASGKSAPSL